MAMNHSEVEERAAKQLADFLRAATDNPRAFNVHRCILCDGDTAVIGVFLPTSETGHRTVARVAGEPPPYTTRVIAYGLCSPCSEFKDAGGRVEYVMNARAQAMRS